MMKKNILSLTFILTCYFVLSFGSQAVVAQETTTTHPFAEQIAAFKQADLKNPPPKHAILFVGSSSIRMWKSLQEDFPDQQVINRGFGGSQFSNVLYYMDRIVLPYQPRQIFIYEGDNDLFAGVSPKKVLERFKTFVQRVHQKLPDTEILFISIKPSLSRKDLLPKMAKANNLIKKYTQQTPLVKYIDIFNPMLNENGKIRSDIFLDDNLHMNEKGYDIWQRVIGPYLD